MFISFFNEIHKSKQNSTRWDAADGATRFAASHLLLYFPMSHKKDARLIWVKEYLLLSSSRNNFMRRYSDEGGRLKVFTVIIWLCLQET